MGFIPAETKEIPDDNVKFAVRREIYCQMIELDIKLKKEILISDYVKLLSEKRQLQELLNQYNNDN
ncbi:hypothetical protein [Flavobacterium sp. UBA6046]|jgi:hypothetical protein|uniref:hypothetical protein n=1 Tax=Flavobacterium sp. UBA6046 TaxID=1946552 RepID=UPI0025C02B73|nr:hypothetical protein [Flavobacterium sp. UBA6046]